MRCTEAIWPVGPTLKEVNPGAFCQNHQPAVIYFLVNVISPSHAEQLGCSGPDVCRAVGRSVRTRSCRCLFWRKQGTVQCGRRICSYQSHCDSERAESSGHQDRSEEHTSELQSP